MKFATGPTNSARHSSHRPERGLSSPQQPPNVSPPGQLPRHCSLSVKARSQAAFTLAEVLAALVFMAIVIPVAIEGLSIAGRAGEVAARKNEAALVAERVLNEALITTNYDQAIRNGTLRQGIRDFRYTLRSEPWNEESNQSDLRLLTAEVGFAAQGQEYQVRLSTLVDNSSTLGQTNSLGNQLR